MAIYRTSSDEARAVLAPGVLSPIRQWSLVTVKTWPESGKTSVHEVDVCADNQRPDACVVKTVDNPPSYGSVALYGSRMPGPIATNVDANDPLICKGGKFVKAVKGEQFYFRALQKGLAGDVINTYPSEGVVT